MAGALLPVIFAPRAARADVPLDLSWSAPSGCPQARDVRERIRAIAGDALRDMARLRADGRIARLDGRYQLTLKIYEGGEARERTIESSSCADLAGAAAVSLGLLLRNGNASRGEASTGTADRARRSDGTAGSSEGAARTSDASSSSPTPPSRTETSPGAGPAPPSSSRGETARTPPATGGEPASRASERRFRVFLRAPAFASAFGRLPSPNWGIGGAVGVLYDQWRLGVDARIFVKQSLWSSQFPDVGVEISPRALSLSACRGFRRGIWELAPCLSLGVEQARMRGTGPHVAASHETVTSFLLAAGGAAHLYLSEWMALVGAVALGVETSRPRVVIDGLGDVRQLGPLKFELLLGPEFIF